MPTPSCPAPQHADRRGYTLPVWVAAAARAAVEQLRGDPFRAEQPLQLAFKSGATEMATVAIPIVAAAPLGDDRALAVARCDPGDGLDLTRDLMVWVEAAWQAPDPGELQERLTLEAGEGVGIHAGSGALCISAFARELIERSVEPLIPPDCGLRLRVIVPTGRQLAERTSNAAFGVVDGLALIGTQAEVQASADPEQLQRTLTALRQRLSEPGFSGDLVLVIGENGLDLAPRLGLPPALLLKCGNWIGPVLVAAAQAGARRLLLFGAQGKLIKLAGGIFHTHHHLADGRAEILTAHAALEGLSGKQLQTLHGAATVERAFNGLEREDPALAERLRRRIATAIEQRSADYLRRHGESGVQVGAALFDRQRRLQATGAVGERLIQTLCASQTDN